MIKSISDIVNVYNFLVDDDFKKVNLYLNNQAWTIQVSKQPENNLDLEIHDFLMLDVSDKSFFNEYLFNKVQQSLGISC